jgi:hypothetical protein
MQEITNEFPLAAAKAAVERYGMKVSVIAKRCDVHRVEVYAFLEPQKFPHIRLKEEKRERLENFFREVLAA